MYLNSCELGFQILFIWVKQGFSATFALHLLPKIPYPIDGYAMLCYAMLCYAMLCYAIYIYIYRRKEKNI